MNKLVASIVLLAAAASAFPSDVFQIKGKPYLIVSNEQASWFDAASFCSLKDMSLVSIEDEEEFSHISEELVARGLQNTYMWIGGTEIGAEDSYYWLNQPNLVNLPHWDPSETFDETEKCVAMYKGYWQHYLCSTPAYFICETSDVTTTTTVSTTTPTTTRTVFIG